MRKLFPLILLAVITQHIQGQNGVAGYWRAVSVVPDGTPDGAVLQFTMELMVEGASVTGTATGASDCDQWRPRRGNLRHIERHQHRQ